MLTDECKVPSLLSVCSRVALVMPLFSSQWTFWPMWPGRSVASPKTVSLGAAAIWTLPVSATSWEKGWASTRWAAMDGLLESTEIPVVSVKSGWLLHRTPRCCLPGTPWKATAKHCCKTLALQHPKNASSDLSHLLHRVTLDDLYLTWMTVLGKGHYCNLSWLNISRVDCSRNSQKNPNWSSRRIKFSARASQRSAPDLLAVTQLPLLASLNHCI